MVNPKENSKAKDKETDTQPTPVKRGGNETNSVGTEEDTSLRGGRNRFCKQCKFTCKDSREFSQHQLSAHGESEETRCSQNLLSKENNGRRGSTKSQSPQSVSSHKTDPLTGSNGNNNNNNPPKMNREADESTGDHIYKDTEEDELDDRLVIAEENDESYSHTPIRSGNIQNRTYICPSCDFSSTSAKVFLHHQKDIHNKDFTIYECDVCDYATRYKQKLPRHRKLHFPGLEFNNSSSGAAGSMSVSDHTADNSDIAMIGEDNDLRRKLDEDLDDELEEEEMDLITDESLVIDDTIKQKTKRTRQEVDPAKYIEVMDESGIKYSCSKCGNIYKWRKSLNKHWKEKHADEKLDGLKPVPPILNPVKHVSSKIAPDYMRQELSDKYMLKKESKPNGYTNSESVSGDVPSSVSDCVMPKMIGPFITNSYIPIYSTENSRSPSSGHPGADHEALDLSSKPTSLSRSTQREPLDFSFKKEPYGSVPPETVAIKSEPVWEDENETSKNADDSQQASPVLQCVKCAFVAKTLIDYSSHMAVHLNKRAFKCAECQQHFNCIEELNSHFGKAHVEKIQEHRDVIQKIPHGLQQTYHLLQMPLASSEFTPTENRQLKCSRCEFVAKWPAELQKHAVSHSEERPFICMVCGSTYKWKWDLVKHFEKSHSTLTNPYKRRSTVTGPNGSCIGQDSTMTISSTANALVDRNLDSFILPPLKKRRLSETDLTTHSFYHDEDRQAKTEATRENQNSSEVFLQNKQPLPRTHERSSSVPPNFNRTVDKSIYNKETDDTSVPGLQITNVFSLVKGSPSSRESQESGSNQISASQQSAEQHRAVNAALRQRINQANNRSRRQTSSNPSEKDKSCADILLPYKCTLCQYRARWPSEITQHMKNHSDEKPFCCPECSYKSKWKWDVVKHMKRCGGGTVKDVIDNSRQRSSGPPNVVLAVREEPSNCQNIPKLSGSHVANGETNLFYKNNINVSTPSAVSVAATVATTTTATATATAAMVAAAVTAADTQSHSQSLLDLRHDSTSSRSNTVFRGLVNDGLYHCFECQFVGHSPAELKRHAYLHSEHKPYVCEVCSYSSRWKCDLKKHMRNYNHHQSHDTSSSHSEGSDRPNPGSSVYNSSPSFQLQKDEKHNKTEDDDFPDDTDVRSSSSFYSPTEYSGKPLKEPNKQSCTKCSFVSDDLATFLQHRLTHDNNHSSNKSSSSSSNTSSDIVQQPPPPPQQQQKQQTTVPINTVSSRTRHLKNRRKPMKQFRCPKCPYVCLTEQDLSIHEGRHKPQGSNAVKCFYCDFSVLNNNKVTLIQHLYLHPEFDPSDKFKLKEILSYSNLLDVWQANEEEDDELDDVSYEFYEPAEQMEAYKEKAAVAEQKKEEKENESQGSFSEPYSVNGMVLKKELTVGARLQCEWCEVAFAHISTLYQHARSVHPISLQQQEYENNIKYDDFPQHIYNGMVINQNSSFNVSLPKIAQTPKKIQPSSVIKQKKNPSPGKTGGPFKCQKCPFIGASSNTYSRHMERHGSNCKHTCLYCDYSIDRLNLLHQHMRGSHGHDVKQSPLNSSGSEKSIHNGFPKAETPNRVILTTPTYVQKTESSNETHLRLIAPKPVETKNNELSHSLPIFENGLNGKYLYRCPICSYTSSKANSTMTHIQMHSTGGGFDAKPLATGKQPDCKNLVNFQQQGSKKVGSDCSQNTSFQSGCDCNETHSDQPKFQSQQQPPQLALKNIFACQICPFKTTSKNSLQDHQDFHGYKGQYQCDFCNFSVDHLNLYCDHSALHTHNNNNNSNNNDNDNNNNSIGNNTSGPNRINNASNSSSSRNSPLQQHHNHQSKRNPTPQVGEQYVNMSHTKVNPHRPFGGVQFRSKYDNDRRNKLNIQQMLKQVKNTGRVRYKCMQCPYRTCCKNNIIKHRKQHIIKSRYKCPYCNYSAARKYLLQQHLKFHRDEPVEQEKDFQDVVLDPYDENSVKSLKDNCDLLNTDKKALPLQTPVSSLGSQYSLENSDMKNHKNSPKSVFAFNSPAHDNPLQNPEINSEEDKVINSNNDNSKGKHFKCNACPFSCNTSYEYSKHSQYHNANMKYQCDYCSYSVDHFKLLAQHQQLHIPQSTYIPSEEDISGNLDASDENQAAPESICSPQTKDAIKDKLFKNPAVTPEIDRDQLYEIDAHLQGNEEAMRYKCQFCPYMSNSLKSYNVHSRMHGLKRKYKCDYCNWSADRLNLLNQHRKVHAREPNFDPNPDELTFLNRETALQHKEITVPPLKHFSKMTTRFLGKKQFPNKTSFVSHMGLHHSHTRYCNYSTDRRNLSQQNEKSHFSQGEEAPPADSTKSRIRCPKCPYHCCTEYLLSSHMKMHESDQRYVCDVCSFSTTNYYTFNKHLENHNAPLQPSEIDEHEDNVEREMYEENESDDEYSCDLCSFSTTSIDEMRVHESQHEGLDDKISCPYCSFTCTKESDIKNHLVEHQSPKPEGAVGSQETDKFAPDLSSNQNDNNPLPSKMPSNSNEDANQNTGITKSDGSCRPPSANSKEDFSYDDQKSQTTANHVQPSSSPHARPLSPQDSFICQYCERKFKDLHQMQTHEKQHLKGYETLEAVQ